MNSAQFERSKGQGPAIWIAGDPADLGVWINRGAYGIVTNTVVQTAPQIGVDNTGVRGLKDAAPTEKL